ncbi:MAG: DUF2288 domain-containing protein [Gallionella sp.]|nr:DUF2288 domain-containing protein [Gallionella sp.]
MTTSNQQEILRAKVNLETAQMPWREMQRYFASGAALFVSSDLDLVETAYQMSADNAALIGQWMADGQFGRVTDEQARTWWDADALLWAVVVSPWVLVQPVTS